MKTADDRWLTRLRAALGSTGFVYEMIFDHSAKWPIYILVVWLLGGPIEQLVLFFTSGRLKFVIQQAPPAAPVAPDPTKPDPGGNP